MNEIPDVLLPLVETHEEDGSPVAVCDPGCGKTFRFGVLWRIKLRGKPAELGIMRGVCWCAYCGTIVGEDECGRPYRIRHSRVVEALEDLQAAANCAWALLPAAQRVQMYSTYPRLAELASEGYMSAEDAQAQVIRAATEEAPDEHADA